MTYSSRFIYPIDGYHVYAIAEALEIPQILNEQVKEKQRESGYLELEHILALAVPPRADPPLADNAFVGGDYLR